MSEENKTEGKNLYELSFHIVSTIPEDKVEGEVATLKKDIAKHNGEVVKEGEAELMDLAYTIVKKFNDKNHKFDKAYFGWVKFTATAEDVEALKLVIDANLNVLRYLLVKTVDDDEHSTSKIPVEVEEEEVKEVNEEKKEEKKEEPAKEEKKSVDDAIDEAAGE